MGQIRGFFRSDFSAFGVGRQMHWNLIWKSHGFVPFMAKLTHFGAKTTILEVFATQTDEQYCVMIRTVLFLLKISVIFHYIPRFYFFHCRLSLSISISLSLALSLSLYVFLSLSLSLTFSFSISLSHFLSFYVFLFCECAIVCYRCGSLSVYSP